MVTREIDLAGRTTNRATWFARLVVRLVQIVFWLAVATAAFPAFAIARKSLRGGIGAALVFLFQRLGATFIKIGQIISTRPDIFSNELIAPLTALQDQVPAFSFAEVRRAIEEDFGRKLEDIFLEIDEKPVASASVAQVHRAMLREVELPPSFSTPAVAVKVRRPGIVRKAYLDEAILEFGARIVSISRGFALISPREAVRQFCEAVNKQLDFRIEAENNHRFCKNFDGDAQLVIPALVEALCSDRVLTMEFVEGVKADKIRAVGSDPTLVARKGVEAVVRMIFQHGFIHADLHPGNLLFLSGNRIAVFDVGLVGELSVEDRRRYSLFCYYVIAGMGAEVARWGFENSGNKAVRDYAAYERDVSEVVARFHDRPLEQVQLTGLIVELYGVARRHRIRFEATFTIANIALMVIEGIGRKIDPKINITREARPHLEAALALAVAAPTPEETALPSNVPTAFAGGRYRIRRLIGEGVRKRVYLARDTRLDRDVALALIRTEGLDDAGRERVIGEARAVARLADHPRIVPVHDTGEEGDVPYVVSQYMGGGTLSGRLLRTTEHRLPLEMALRFGDQILQALEHAHRQGIVHRDVKPENIWLTEDGFAKLGDFGLARMLGRPVGSMEGMTVGTALYMAPEQALGRDLDHRSDLYSFGATLYELLTGRPPFEGDSVAEVVARHINANPEPPSRRNPQIAPALDVLIMRLLAKAPENRFESAAAVRHALRDLPSADVAPAVPEAESATPATPFVGREQEMARLRKGLEESLAGRGRLFVLVGEPGIGKTRAAELLASYAAGRGARVLGGRSFEGAGAPAFWPWTQILRAYLEDRDPARLETELGPRGAYVAQIVPELRQLVPSLPPMAEADGEEARFRLFDAVTSFLKRAAMAQPLVLVLDDLHWADKPSLLLLQFLTRELTGARLLVIGTYRDVDVQHGHPLAELLPSLRRERAFERVLLRGLGEEDVRALINSLAGAEVPSAFVRAIHRETEGNPFFIEETLRHLVEEGIVTRENGRWTSRLSPEEMGLPEGVREVIGRRLARLGEECRKLLVTAAALGREFEVRTLQRVAGLEIERTSDLLEEAIRAQIVEPEKGGFRLLFSHGLIRETLYGELTPVERVALHGKIAAALEQLYASEAETHLPELAHHYFEAAPAGDVERAIEFATRAAKRADAQYAYEEAAGFYDRAMRALDSKGRTDDRRRCDLLLGLGVAQSKSDFLKSRATLKEAADLAERAGRGDVLAQAALAYAGDGWRSMAGRVEPEMRSILERGLAALPAADSALRATVMARLAGALALIGDQQERMGALFQEASAMARRVADRRALGVVLQTQLLTRWGFDDVETLRADAATLFDLGKELRDDRLLFTAHYAIGLIACEAGDFDAGRVSFDEAERLANEIRIAEFRYYAALLRAGLKLLTAGFQESEAIVQGLFDLGAGAENRMAAVVYLIQRFSTLFLHGKPDEAAALVKQWLSIPGFDHVAAQGLYGMACAEAGRKEEARAVLELLAVDDFSRIPRDLFILDTIGWAIVMVEALGDRERAPRLYELVVSFGDRILSNIGMYYVGSTAHALGLLAKTLGRFDEAIRHFEHALEIERQGPIMVARTRYAFARTLALRAEAGDRERAIALAAAAVSDARTYELTKLGADALALKLELEGAAFASPRSSIDAVAASIEAKGLDLRDATASNGTVTLVFSDMEGFTEMTERLGDAKAHALMQVHHRIIRASLREHGGKEIEEQGDGFLLAFPKATEALRWAIGVQRAFAAYRDEHADEPIRVRMGIHAGEPIRQGARFFGKTVILAARVSAYARGSEILASSLVYDLAEPNGEFTFDAGEEVTLKGLAGTHRVHGVVWDPDVPARQPEAVPAPAPESADNVFRREGDVWTLAYAGKNVRVRDAKGLQYMSVLLARAGEEVHSTELVNGSVARGSAVERGDPVTIAADLGDTGEALDPRARAQYRERLESLRAELEEARANNDTGRAEAVEHEMEFITHELSAAFGLGGRARKGASHAERARKAVSSRITESITRLRQVHPELGAHLTNSVHLGLFCRYSPEKPVRWVLR